MLTKISTRTKLGNDDDVLARLETILENDDKVASEDKNEGRRGRKSRTQSSNDFDADVDDEYSMEDGSEGSEYFRYIVDCSNLVCVLAIRRQKSLKGFQGLGQQTRRPLPHFLPRGRQES